MSDCLGMEGGGDRIGLKGTQRNPCGGNDYEFLYTVKIHQTVYSTLM